jgi:uncharacterized protein
VARPLGRIVLAFGAAAAERAASPLPMKTFLSLLFVTLIASVSLAAESLPVFNATLTMGKDHRFVLINATGKASNFLKLGDSFDGYKLTNYDAKAGTLTVERDGKSSQLSIVADAATANAAMPGSRATVADAEALLNAMNFEQLMDKMLAGIRKGQTQMIDQMMGRMLPPQADDQTRRDITEFQKKVIAEMMGGLSGEEMKGDIAKAYSEVFTKEELQQLGAFYQSPLGKTFAEKQPELTEKMNAVMAPRMMAAMPKVQAMMRDFSMEQRAKREAAKGGGSAPAPAPAPKN